MYILVYVRINMYTSSCDILWTNSVKSAKGTNPRDRTVDYLAHTLISLLILLSKRCNRTETLQRLFLCLHLRWPVISDAGHVYRANSRKHDANGQWSWGTAKPVQTWPCGSTLRWHLHSADELATCS